MKIHFVCRGNVYRSRLAETYLKSLELPHIEVSSSGTHADKGYSENGPISWYALRIIANNNLLPFMKTIPTQATDQLLSQQDFVVFMDSTNYAYAQHTLGFSEIHHSILNVEDLNQFRHEEFWRDPERMEATEKTFEEIKDKVNELVKTLQANS